MLPHEIMRTSIPELLSFIDGYHRRLRHSWEQHRLLVYSIYSITTAENERVDIEDWMPLWFDLSPEERKLNAAKERKVRGMVADKDIEHYRSLGINI